MDHLEGIAFVHVYPAYVKAHLTFDEGWFPDKKKITDLKWKLHSRIGLFQARFLDLVPCSESQGSHFRASILVLFPNTVERMRHLYLCLSISWDRSS